MSISVHVHAALLPVDHTGVALVMMAFAVTVPSSTLVRLENLLGKLRVVLQQLCFCRTCILPSADLDARLTCGNFVYLVELLAT